MKINLVKIPSKVALTRRMDVRRVCRAEDAKLDKHLEEACNRKNVVNTAASVPAAAEKECASVIQSLTHKANVAVATVLKTKARLRKWEDMTLLMLGRNLLATVFDADPITDADSFLEVANKVINEPVLAEAIKDTKLNKFDIDIVSLNEDGTIKVDIVRVEKKDEGQCAVVVGPDMSKFTDFLWKIDFRRSSLDVGIRYVNDPK